MEIFGVSSAVKVSTLATRAAKVAHVRSLVLPVFLKMGGTKERIWLAEICGEAVKSTLLSFDASKAKCFLAKDKERLFAVIESGYGDFLRFNMTVRSIFSVQKGMVPATKAKRAKAYQVQIAPSPEGLP